MAKVGRRGFLRTVVVSAGAAGLAPVLPGCDGGPSRPVEEVFPQSVASGDPRETSIVLWTRAVPEGGAGDADVTLELASDEAFASPVAIDAGVLVAREEADHCVRVKVTGLTAGATYFYRFTHAGTRSRAGRFRTAPAADADTPVRFAFVSCQDYVGRYYNTLLRLLDDEHDDLAFVLHLGDYVYETTGDPGFMMTGSERTVRLRAPEEAIALGSGDGVYHAARSLSNYRDLYRTYRSDPILQRLHERFPFICIWDDHEFSDDSWQDHGTYSDGLREEQDTERRRASEQAWWEYQPAAPEDAAAGLQEVDPSELVPSVIGRAFRFGRHLALAVTDYRSFRPDHPTPEDAFPGAVLLDEAQVQAALARLEADGELPAGTTAGDAFAAGGFRPYVDLEDAAFADHKRALEILLTAGYAGEGVEPARAATLATRYAQGKTDAAILAATLEAGRAALPSELAALTVDAEDPSLPRGLPYALLGKSGLVGQLGARYLTVQRTYDLVQVWRTRVAGDEAHDDVLGAAQRAWLAGALGASDATWNVVGNSVCNTSLVLDLGPFEGALPEGLPPERFYLNVDHWDGFPERRRQLMRDVYRPANAVLLAGDIHASYATDFGADAAGNRVIELTTSSVSSGPFRELLERTANGVPSIRDSGLVGPVLDALDFIMPAAFPPLVLSQSEKNGVTVVSLDASELRADFHLLPTATVARSYYDDPSALAREWEVLTYVTRKDAGKNGPLTAA